MWNGGTRNETASGEREINRQKSNYEGLRIACQSPEEDGWFLLRLSLHDPVLPLNIESNVQGGVEKIRQLLLTYFQSFEALDLTALTTAKD